MEDILSEQQQYYNRRAEEYDQWWYCTGRYDKGTEKNRIWMEEVEECEAFFRNELQSSPDIRSVIELAPGTGIWTKFLLENIPNLESLVLVDGSTEMNEINKNKTQDIRPEIPRNFLCQDLFQWKPEVAFDLCFFGFWLSHVPAVKLDSFMETVVKAAVKEGGRLVFIDSLSTLQSYKDRKVDPSKVKTNKG